MASAEGEEEFEVFDDETENLTVVAETPTSQTKSDESTKLDLTTEQRTPPVYYPPTGAGFPEGFGTQSFIYCLVMLVWTLAMVFYFAYVHAYMVFTQQSPPSSFNGLRITDVPFYNAAPVSASTSEVYFSFDYYTWMTDYLLILLPPYALGAILLAVVWRKRSVAIFGVYIVGVVFILLELAKAIYWTLIWAGWFGLSCAKYQFCLSHNPGEPVGTAIFQFKFAVIFAYVSALLSFGVILTQSIVRSGRLHTLVVNGKAPRHRPPTTQSDADVLFSAAALKRRRARYSQIDVQNPADKPKATLTYNNTFWSNK
jgi:hypothetical protein